ncbi:DUF6629 family protein [Acaryochloris sp. IP29b_bin.148]|uniref:DUF6629 family protein n=1 Tax=Acaryochloris sp. IP29b_bin.148 TaxID=2969218 RepID=UPI0026150CE8|nr:DUF6629 family protein [Acaryochloris sp. IP29b_bin.148]
MCFSTTASFTAAALLFPAGIYASKIAEAKDRQLLPLAVIPIGFSIQQSFEGLVWLNLDHADLVRVGALGFFGFSHGIWPAWPAFAVWVQEDRPWARKILIAMLLFGCFFGLSLYGPFWRYPDWLTVEISHGSIQYQTQLLYDRIFPRDVTRLIYLLMVVGPACLSKFPQLRVLGGLVALSMIVTYLFFNYAFVSVWCFFAAVLSLYLIYVLRSVSLQKDPRLQRVGTE